MPLRLQLALLTACLLSLQGASAQSYPCQDRSRWLETVPASQRDLVLLHVSANAATEFFKLVKQPNVKPETQLWAYKTLGIGHLILLQSPYASSELRPIFSSVALATANIIRGDGDFDAFRAKLLAQGTAINARIRTAGPDERTVMLTHTVEIEQLSNCVLLTATYNAIPEKDRP